VNFLRTLCPGVFRALVSVALSIILVIQIQPAVYAQSASPDRLMYASEMATAAQGKLSDGEPELAFQYARRATKAARGYRSKSAADRDTAGIILARSEQLMRSARKEVKGRRKASRKTSAGKKVAAVLFTVGLVGGVGYLAYRDHQNRVDKSRTGTPWFGR
jgi:hypothetical protein